MIYLAKLGILTHGGDAPGLNQGIKWVTKQAKYEGIADEIIGIRMGFKGLIGETDTITLDGKVVKAWDISGGTELGTSRYNPFKNNTQYEVLDNLKRLGIDYLIVFGGDGTISLTQKLREIGLEQVVAIPKTIDKDIWGTDYTIGFDTAVNQNIGLLSNIRTTASSHGIIQVVELMGRDTGHLALQSGIAISAGIILIPEEPFSFHRLIERVKERRQAGARYDLVIFAEKARTDGSDGLDLHHHTDNTTGLQVYPSAYLADLIKRATGYETRSTVLGHVQRGGSPTAYDKLVARYMGIAAVDLIKQRSFGQMVSLKEGRISSTPLEEVAGKVKVVKVEVEYDTDRLGATKTGLGRLIY